MGILEDILDKIDTIAKKRFKNRTGLAHHLGVEPNLISRWYGGKTKRMPRMETLAPILDQLGFRIISPEDPIPSPAALELGDVTMIPHVWPYSNLEQSSQESQSKFTPFLSKALRQMGLSDPQAMSILEVRGNAMDPTITDKDLVLISLREKDVFSGEIYVIRVDGELIVRRLVRQPGKILVKADNPAFEPFDILPDQLDIIGRIRWQGRFN